MLFLNYLCCKSIENCWVFFVVDDFCFCNESVIEIYRTNFTDKPTFYLSILFYRYLVST